MAVTFLIFFGEEITAAVGEVKNSSLFGRFSSGGAVLPLDFYTQILFPCPLAHQFQYKADFFSH
jgi:hypothetical protein